MIFVPTSLDRFVENLIYRWPDQFTNRTDALHRMFCVLGSGFIWVHRRLRQIDHPHEIDDSYTQQELRNLRAKLDGTQSKELARHYKSQIARLTVETDRQNQQTNFIKAHAEHLALVSADAMAPYPIYPLSNDCLLAQVPDDVASDWLDGAREMIFFIFSHSPTNEAAAGFQKHNINNIRVAETILQDLEKRFGKPHEDYPSSYAEWLDNARKNIKKVLAALRGEDQAASSKSE